MTVPRKLALLVIFVLLAAAAGGCNAMHLMHGAMHGEPQQTHEGGHGQNAPPADDAWLKTW